MNTLGSKNPNWRGGKTTSSHGYILIRVGVKHHLSDVRGYAYEHRVVAEKIMGRKLNPKEIVHHIDGDRKNNSPDNLSILNGNFEHLVNHRRLSSNRQLLHEPNLMMKCLCGCGEVFRKFDNNHRPRKYISGHNPQPSPTKVAIVQVLDGGALSARQIANRTMKSLTSIKTALTKLHKKGVVVRIKHGTWALGSTE